MERPFISWIAGVETAGSTDLALRGAHLRSPRGNSAATTAALGRTRFFGKCRILIVSELEDNKARGCGQQSK
jgi:hypothetical protein